MLLTLISNSLCSKGTPDVGPHTQRVGVPGMEPRTFYMLCTNMPALQRVVSGRGMGLDAVKSEQAGLEALMLLTCLMLSG